MLRLYSVDPDPEMIAKIVYFVHDLSDPAVHRRVRMLVAGGAAVTLIGFRRSAEAPNAVEGLRPIDLGQTADGMLVRRMLSVVGALVRLGGMAEHICHANVILARNLEMLVPAIRARKRYAPQATVAYECLDIHRMLLSNRLHGRLFRLLESKLFRQRIIPNQPIRQGGPGGGLTEGAPASLSPIISTLFSTSLIGDGKPRGTK